MASDTAKAAFDAHFAALFAADISGGSAVLTSLRNLEDPEPPKTAADLGKTHLFLQYPPHSERASCIGGGQVPWRETGAILLHVLVASGRNDASADALFRRATNSLRNQTIGGRVDIIAMHPADSGHRFGGNWWGKSIAIEYQVEDIATA